MSNLQQEILRMLGLDEETLWQQEFAADLAADIAEAGLQGCTATGALPWSCGMPITLMPKIRRAFREKGIRATVVILNRPLGCQLRITVC